MRVESPPPQGGKATTMSTRATYQFIGDERNFEPTVTFYVHYDGYPQGAAEYFRDMLKQKHGGLATKFMHAVDAAELTLRHEVHRDTEYRYTITGDHHLTALVKIDSDTWDIFFEGTLAEFIKQYGAEKKQTRDPQPTPTSSPGLWRVPTVQELHTLVNFKEALMSDWLNSQGFTNVQSYGYWSSTSYADDTSSAWVVGMDDGEPAGGDKSYYYYVWPVRSGHRPFGPSVVAEYGRFTDNGDGSMADNLTGLEWMKDAQSCRMPWQDALDYMETLNKEEEQA
ncbi:hypothetical protein MBAV_005343 [Candidatus Magnetobacterium bavaricum]|uniref:Lcl C-terminal domain-containing protein n=1 Tax=Candidatus Magnetobacterium bavaricum TaxID=29290 RepID=A0A0F3GP56_9BACT|nr:hypothetical protein MBAV_005343 [Candidatus Magnetobacterium bavaricum]